MSTDPRIAATLRAAMERRERDRPNVTRNPKSAQMRAVVEKMKLTQQHHLALDRVAHVVTHVVLLHLATRRIAGEPLDFVGALWGVTGSAVFECDESLSDAVEDVIDDIEKMLAEEAPS